MDLEAANSNCHACATLPDLTAYITASVIKPDETYLQTRALLMLYDIDFLGIFRCDTIS